MRNVYNLYGYFFIGLSFTSTFSLRKKIFTENIIKIKQKLYFQDEEEEEEFMVRTAQTLRLEFRQVLKIDNLQCLTALTRLFLDNNLIERYFSI